VSFTDLNYILKGQLRIQSPFSRSGLHISWYDTVHGEGVSLFGTVVAVELVTYTSLGGLRSVVEDHVWISSRRSLLRGSRLGVRAVIGAGSVVT
jgi:acetyltransferase-like isoleucine patch superfamily enzyme